MTDKPRSDELDAFVRGSMERWTVPGIALGIWNGGAQELHAYGLANFETGYEMAEDTIMQIGSISKIFTTTLLMTLVDEGLLALDDPISKHLPGFRLSKDGTQDIVKIQNLVTHTSGVYGDHFDDFGWGDNALGDYVASMSDLRQVYETGTIWSYTNSAFNLAGYIIEKKLEMPFEQAMRERIFEPLGMERSFYFPHEAITYRVSVGHTLVDPAGDEHEVARRWPIPRASGPAGSISSTAGDMLRFARFHMGDGTWEGKRILSEDSIKLMQEVHVENSAMADAWGLGWQINFYDNVKVIGHGGSTNGFQAHLDVAPEKDFALVVLTNSGRGAASYREITDWVLETYLGLSKPEIPAIEMTDDQLSEFAGKYSQPLADVTLSVENDGLKMETVSKSALADTDEDKTSPPVHLEPIGDDRFRVTEGAAAGYHVDFFRNDDDSIRFVRVGGRVSDRVNS
ncbi:MAG: serine hydrolase domain-containing protein [Thermomicrobiales bacterium]